MFLCKKCHPEDHCLSFASSVGRCEGCGKTAICVDCHSNRPLKPERRVITLDMNGNPMTQHRRNEKRREENRKKRLH